MKKLPILTLAIPLLYSPFSSAELQLNGFASVRATQINTDGGTSTIPEIEEGELTFKGESLFAIQARADLGDGLSATIQLYADGQDDFDVEARWAYVSYQLSDTHQLNAGRLANPIFHQSEYEKVGYAHNFARLPRAVYSGFDFATIEGISLNSTFDLGDGDYTLETKLLYGNWEGEVFIAAVGGTVPLAFESEFSVNATLSGDWWKVFAGGFKTEMGAETFDNSAILPAMQPAINAAIATGATEDQVDAFTGSVTWDGKDGIYWFAGFGIDYNDWLIDYEYTAYGVDDSSDAENENYFFAVGKRMDQFILTVHYEESKQVTDYDFLSDVTHPILQGAGRGLQDALGESEFDGYGITLRYDFHSNAAFKVDYFTGSHNRADIDDYTVMSAGIDLVF